MAYTYRVKCACGHVMNTNPGGICPKCKMPVQFPQGGQIFLYRKGNFFGAGGGLSLYVDEAPMGKIGNRELICIPLPFGTHRLHVAAGFSRKCQDLYVTLTPEAPIAYAKAWIKVGAFVNSFVIEPSVPSEMPL